VGDALIQLKEGEQCFEQVESIEKMELKKRDFIELHTTSYTIIVDGILAHCSSINDKAILRPFE